MYLVNRDPEKTKQVVAEMVASGFADAKQTIIVVESVEQAKTSEANFSCIPNNTPATEGERTARAVADNLFRTERPGGFLDMSVVVSAPVSRILTYRHSPEDG